MSEFQNSVLFQVNKRSIHKITLSKHYLVWKLLLHKEDLKKISQYLQGVNMKSEDAEKYNKHFNMSFIFRRLAMGWPLHLQQLLDLNAVGISD